MFHLSTFEKYQTIFKGVPRHAITVVNILEVDHEKSLIEDREAIVQV